MGLFGFHRHVSSQVPLNDNPLSETGAEALIGDAWSGDFVNAEYTGAVAGHPVPVGNVGSKFYETNPARLNGADLEPVPITPVRKQNWPEMQIQLRNGWGTLSFGRKLNYDDYLRMLTDSASKSRNYLIPQPSSAGRAGNTPGPSPLNVNTYIGNTSGAQPNNPGGPGQIANGVDLRNRRFYG